MARLEHGEIRPLHVLAEKVQLGKGLKNHQLADDAVARGLACLNASTVSASVRPDKIRAVGTNALRSAQPRGIHRACRGHSWYSVDVNTVEKSALSVSGVAHTLADDEHSRLVVDIGGGSTEFILGHQFEPKRLESSNLAALVTASVSSLAENR